MNSLQVNMWSPPFYSHRITTILFSRLLLNLREVAHSETPSGSQNQLSSLRFARVIGPLGNPVNDGLSDPDDDEDMEMEMDGAKLEETFQEVATDHGAAVPEGAC